MENSSGGKRSDSSTDRTGKSVKTETTVRSSLNYYTFGDPSIAVPVEKHGFSDIRISLNKTDPFIRKIKKGSQILVRGYPKGFMMQDVVIDGVIVSDGTSVLIDGKAFTPPKKAGKKE